MKKKKEKRKNKFYLIVKFKKGLEEKNQNFKPFILYYFKKV